LRYAGFWLRLLAALIDSIVLIPVDCIFYLFDRSAANIAYSLLANQVVMWLYFAIFESQGWQGTPGKYFLKIKVTDLSGNRISFARATARYFSKFFSTIILGIGYLMIAFTKRKQGLHDLIAETLVIKDGESFDTSSSFNSNNQTTVIRSGGGDFSPTMNYSTDRKITMAGFDSNGNVLRLSFDLNDPKLNSSGLVLGRDSIKCDLHVSDQSISRRHARIFKKNGEIWIEDLGSTNGMVVNSRQIQSGEQAMLTTTGNLAIGGIELTLGGGRI
jgi:uncharacterized RDD family membrane protein YckC